MLAGVRGRVAMSGSQSSLREANRALIVETVHRHGGLTQVELAGSTGLSAATVSTIVKELLAAGVVDTRNTTRSGRRAQMVTIAHRVGLAVGIHIGARHLRIALGDVTNEVVAEQTLPLPDEHRLDTSLDRAALLVGGPARARGIDARRGRRDRDRPAGARRQRHRHGLRPRHHARLGRGPRRPRPVEAAGLPGVRRQRRQPRRARREHARGVPRRTATPSTCARPTGPVPGS